MIDIDQMISDMKFIPFRLKKKKTHEKPRN